MEKEFVPYEQAVALKELGFDEPCFGRYDGKGNNKGKLWYEMPNSGQDTIPVGDILAPTFSQAFRWFREKYGLLNHLATHLNPYGEDGALEESYGYRIMRNNDGWKCSVWEKLSFFDTYEEAELECLNKLIDTQK